MANTSSRPSIKITHEIYVDVSPIPSGITCSPTTVDWYLKHSNLSHEISSQTPTPTARDEQKWDSRAVDVDSKRFRNHLFRYGFTRRAGKYQKISFKEKLANPLVTPEYNPFKCSKSDWNNPQTGPTPKQRLFEDCHENWRWIGYKCSCCYCGPSITVINRVAAQREARETMNKLRLYSEDMTRGKGWWDDEDSYCMAHELAYRVPEYDVNDEIESNKVWGADRGRWDVLVDGAMRKWEGRRRREVEGLGWEVCTEGTAPSEVGGEEEEEDDDDGEWVDWEAVMSLEKRIGGEDRDGDGDTVTDQWTECGSEWEVSS